MIGPLHTDHEYDVMLTPAAMLRGRGEAALWSPKGQSGLARTSTSPGPHEGSLFFSLFSKRMLRLPSIYSIRKTLSVEVIKYLILEPPRITVQPPRLCQHPPLNKCPSLWVTWGRFWKLCTLVNNRQGVQVHPWSFLGFPIGMPVGIYLSHLNKKKWRNRNFTILTNLVLYRQTHRLPLSWGSLSPTASVFSFAHKDWSLWCQTYDFRGFSISFYQAVHT